MGYLKTSVGFKQTKPGARNCVKGYPCKAACINKDRNCKNPLEGQARTYAEYLKTQIKSSEGGANLPKTLQKEDVYSQSALITTMTQKPEAQEGESKVDVIKRWQREKQEVSEVLASQSAKPNPDIPEDSESWRSMSSTQEERDGMISNLLSSNPMRKAWVSDPSRLKAVVAESGNPPYPEEVLAIKLYTTNDFGAMNGALRGLSDEDYDNAVNSNMVQGRDKDSIRAEALRDSRVVTSALNALPDYQDVVYRGVRVPKGMTLDDVRSMYSEGSVVTERGFTSTSKESSGSFGARDDIPIQMVINSRSGKSVEEFSETKSEREVLFRPFTQFRSLRDPEMVNGKLVVYLDEVQ